MANSIIKPVVAAVKRLKKELSALGLLVSSEPSRCSNSSVYLFVFGTIENTWHIRISNHDLPIYVGRASCRRPLDFDIRVNEPRALSHQITAALRIIKEQLEIDKE